MTTLRFGIKASDRSTALAHLRHAMPRLVLLDLGLPLDAEGGLRVLDHLREALQLNPIAKVIVITGNSDRAKAVAAIQSCAFIEKPVQLDVLRVVLQGATYLSNLERENHALQEQSDQNEFEGLVGTA